MDCSEAKTHLSAFASGLTNDLDKGEIEAHLASCEECSLEVELLRGRASGKAAPPPPSDWTLEKIFGGDGQAGGSPTAGPDATEIDSSPSGPSASEPPAPSASSLFEAEQMSAPAPAASSPPPAAPSDAPAPSAPSAASAPSGRPSMILPPPPAGSDEPVEANAKGKSKKGKSGSWDFEPADASREAAPPEESLVFAEQALNRKQETGSKSKSSARRAVAWSLGGLAGLGLLGVSVWLAVAVHETPTQEVTTRAARSKPANEPAPTPSVSAPDSETASKSPESSSGTTPEADPAPTNAVPAPTATAPKPPAKTAAGERTLQARAVSPGMPLVSDASHGPATPAPPAPTSVAPKMSNPVTVAPVAKKSAAAPPGTTTPPAATHPPSTSEAVRSTPPPSPLKHDDDDMWPTDDPVRPASKATKTTTSAATEPKPEGSTTSSFKVSTPPAPVEAPRVEVPSTTVTGKAIDRLHLATDKANGDQDLAALRQLKAAWKDLLRTAVGKDRSRAKREYADCLWDIQAITGRDADQRETLNAYRDYLLNAPAGGADARSAERLRELEDATHERR